MSSRKLKIHLSSGSNLLAADKNGKSDPFCLVTLLEKGTGSPIKLNSIKSKVVKKTLNPAWDQWLDFPLDMNLPPSSLPTVKISCFDSDTLSSEPLGELVVSLEEFHSNLLQSESMIEKALHKTSKMTKAATGSITFSINFTLPYVDSSVPLSEEVVDMENPPLVLPPHIDLNNQEVHHHNITSPNYLHVMLVRCRDLSVMDKPGMLSRNKDGGSSDPVCTMSVSNNSNNKVVSSIKKKELNPVWNEQFLLPCSDPAASLKITIDDYDMGSGNDFMGQISLPLVSLKTGLQSRSWHRLGSLNGDTESKSLGDILVGVIWVCDEVMAEKASSSADNNAAKPKPGFLKKLASKKEPPETVASEEVPLEPLTDLDMAECMLTSSPALSCDDVKMEGKVPNEVHVMVIKAKYILPMDNNGKGLLGGMPKFGRKKKQTDEEKEKEKEKEKKKKIKGTSDPFVSIKSSVPNSPSFKTDAIKKTLSPVWKKNNAFVVPCTDPGATLTFEMRDADKLTTSFMGKVGVEMKKLGGRREVREVSHTSQLYN